MDQKIVVGIGNIYAAEALFRAGIRPSRRSGKITRAEAGAIVRASQLVLAAAIKQGGTTIRNFRQAGGSSGYFQVHLDVYGREGEACRKCGGAIRNTIIGGRSSFWCSKCQK